LNGHAALNKVFRLVWSALHQAWIAVPESARGRGKRRVRVAAGLLAAVTATLAQAGPMGGQVVQGTGSIAQAGSTTTVTQSSAQLSLNWRSFDTAAHEVVNFVQPSASAIAVNRVTGTDATRFFGQLNANGQVYLINPNGILFGAGAQVNVGGLVASTLDLDDASLGLAGRRFAGTGTGSVVNQGQITAAEGGYVAFVGNHVANQGQVVAPRGTVALGGGNDVTLTFADNRLLSLRVDASTLDNLADNGGLLRADGGAVLLSAGARDALVASVVNNTGVIEARSVLEVDGTIVLDGGVLGAVASSGTLDASGRSAGASGGTVKVLGHAVTLADGSVTDVSGQRGGGTVLVGGNFYGAGPEQNAQSATIASNAEIRADALSMGSGGKVAVWSDGDTGFNGRISAKGGQAGGDGGFVETSGKNLRIGAGAWASTLAPQGCTGEWLLDPMDIVIAPAGGHIRGEDITAALQSSNVTIRTGDTASCSGVSCGPGSAGAGDITIRGGDMVGGYDWTSNTTLTLTAYRDINIIDHSVIDASAGTGNIVLRADNTARGIGTVHLDNTVYVGGNPSGTVKIYYNPTDYATPTDYAGMRDIGGFDTFQLANLQTYMAINMQATVQNKVYDGNTAAQLSDLSVSGGCPRASQWAWGASRPASRTRTPAATRP
jgi:filamentous hemagglutinin family protein